MQSDTSPGSGLTAVTPSDSGAVKARALYVGVGGDITVDVAPNGSNILLKNVPTGAVLPVAATRVYATGTTATNIVAIF